MIDFFSFSRDLVREMRAHIICEGYICLIQFDDASVLSHFFSISF